MRYSVLSRFQAVFLGAALGEELGIDSQTHRSRRIPTGLGDVPNRNLSSWQPAGKPDLFPGTSLMVQRAEGLIQSGGRVQSAPVQKGDNSIKDEASSTWFWATLPVMLFCHEDDIKLLSALGAIVRPQDRGAVLAVSTAIAQALREQLHPKTLIPQTIAVLERSTELPGTNLLKLLEQVQTGLEQNASLATLTPALRSPATLTDRTVAMAFYCFLSTPEDLRLAVLRAAQATEAPLTAALTGALAGAYNSTIGIPLAWRREALSQLRM
jgi:ADP-ribosylglycohydrolase